MHNMHLIVLVVLLVSACQQPVVRDEDSPRYRVAVGSHIVLNRALTIPKRRARVFIQDGTVTTLWKMDIYRPFCNFEVYTLSEGNSRIEPDSFVVTGVREDDEQVVDGGDGHRLVPRFAGADGHAITLIIRFVRHSIRSDSQPDVIYFTCYGGFAEPFDVAYPTIREMRKTLGELVTIELKS